MTFIGKNGKNVRSKEIEMENNAAIYFYLSISIYFLSVIYILYNI